MEAIYFVLAMTIFLFLPACTLVLFYIGTRALKRLVPNCPLWLRTSIVRLQPSISILLFVVSVAVSGELFWLVLKFLGH